VYKNYSDINLGSKVRPSSGFDFVFSHEDEAIILEDDSHKPLIPSFSAS